jgi:uncharacterized protein YukE
MSQPMTYHYADVEGHGNLLQSQAGSLELTQRQINNDLNHCADFWGGSGSAGFQQFVAELNRNFQVIYEQLGEHGGKIKTVSGNTAHTDSGVGGTWA